MTDPLISPDIKAVGTEMIEIHNGILQSGQDEMVDWLIRDFYNQTAISRNDYEKTVRMVFGAQSPIYAEFAEQVRD